MGNRAGSPLLQLTLWRLREFLRQPEALFWVFAFPVILAVTLGIAFGNRGAATIRVAVERRAGSAELGASLEAAPSIEVLVLDSAEAHRRLRTGRVSLDAIAGDPVVLRYDSTRAESERARLAVEDAIQEAAGRRDVRRIRRQRVAERGSRYIDFLIPGLIAMNIMGTGLFGVGYAVLRQRNHRLLKRLAASPMRKRHYLLSLALARLVFLVFEVGVVLLFGHLAFGVPVRGSLLAIVLITALGALTFASIGLLLASRARTLEGVSGLMNLVVAIVWVFSGIFFPYSNFPEALHPFIKAIPLTALNDALRAVMLDGSSLIAVGGLLAVVAAWGAGSFGLALRIFRWE